MPDRLRLNNYRSAPVKAADIKPPSPSTDTHLAPLKVAKAKQSPVPLNVKTQHSSPGSPREAGTPELSNDNSKQWARKGKVKADPLTLSPVRFVFSHIIMNFCFFLADVVLRVCPKEKLVSLSLSKNANY